MRRDDNQPLSEDVDLDRVRATPRGVLGGWVVVVAIGALMFVVPPTVSTADVAFEHAKRHVEKVEHRIAQSLWLAPAHVRRC